MQTNKSFTSPYASRCAEAIRFPLHHWLTALLLVGAQGAVSTSVTARARELPVAAPAEFKRILREVSAGDSIVLADGVWQDADLLFVADGEAERPITLRPQTPGGVRFTGESRLRIGGQHLVVDGFLWSGGTTTEHVIAFRADSRRPASHCRLTNCAIVDFSPSERKVESKWVSLYGQHNRVDHCYFAGKTNSGATLVVWLSETPNQHRIDRNHFGHRPSLGSNGGETIRIGTSDWSMHDSSTVVEQNYFHRCNGEVEILSSKSCNNVLRHNTFVDCEGALTLRHGNRALVDGNYFFGHGNRRAGGIRVIGEDHRIINNYLDGLDGDEGRSALSLMNGLKNSPLHGHFQVKRATVAFNTLVHCRSGIVIGLRDEKEASLAPTDCTLANNIVVAGPKRSSITWLDEPTGFTWLGNLFQTDKSLERRLPSGVRYIDVAMIRGNDELWRPGPSSAAIGAAEGEFAWVREDIDGQPRQAPLDVGCDQRSSARTRLPPLTAADVGPSWHPSSKRD